MKHEEKVKQAIAEGKQFIVISDTDNEAYESGFADYLMNTYNYSNMGSGFRANIQKPKKTKGDGFDFSDPHY